jgi:hypothetical protein
MLLQCHQHLHLVVEFDITNQNIDANNNLNIFKMTMSYNEPMRELVNRNFYLSSIIMWIVRRLNLNLNGGKKMNHYFLQLGSLQIDSWHSKVTNRD